MTKTIIIASKEAEQIVLGRMLQSVEDRKIGCSYLEKDHFFYAEHKLLFASLLQFDDSHKPAEIALLIELLKHNKVLEQVNGPDYLMGLAQSAPMSVYIEEYIKIIKEHWGKRKALEELSQLQAKISSSHDIHKLCEDFSQKLSNLTKKLRNLSTKSFKQISAGNEPTYLENLEFRRDYFLKHKKPYIDGVSSGYESIDNLIGGFGNSNLIILASRPGMGKTAIALNFAERIAKKHSVGFISLEMTAIQLYERILSMKSEVSGNKIREGCTTDQEWQSIKNADNEVAKLPIYVHEGGYFINDIISRAKQLKDEQDIKVLIIDYLQLIQGRGETRLAEISNITRVLKNLCIELHIPIICLAQLSRKVEERVNHRPVLSDLRESGTIEQDADVVSFLMRPDYYDEKNRPDEADLIIAKNRHGKTGEVTLLFRKKFAKFEHLERVEENSHDLF